MKINKELANGMIIEKGDVTIAVAVAKPNADTKITRSIWIKKGGRKE